MLSDPSTASELKRQKPRSQPCLRVLVLNPNSYHQAYTFGLLSLCLGWGHMEAVCSKGYQALALEVGDEKRLLATCHH